jgi:hypothetical protein
MEANSDVERSRGTNPVFVMFVVICIVVLIVIVVAITAAISQAVRLADIERSLVSALGTIIEQFSLLGVSILQFFTDLTTLVLGEIASLSTQLAQAFDSVARFLQQQIETTIVNFTSNVIKYTGNLAQILLQSLTTMGLDFAKVTSNFAAFTQNVVLKLESIIPQTVAAVATFVISMFNTVFSWLDSVLNFIIDLINSLNPFSLTKHKTKMSQPSENENAYLSNIGKHLQNLSQEQLNDYLQHIYHTVNTVSGSLAQALSMKRVTALL